ncbi:MAG: twin-arginine translocation signal domain-containing protein [Planctomycetota bacterium]
MKTSRKTGLSRRSFLKRAAAGAALAAPAVSAA